MAGHKLTFIVSTLGYPFATLSHTTLPSGLLWTTGPNGKATIWGIPTTKAAGATRVTLTAANSLGKAKQALTITIGEPPKITSKPKFSVAAGQAFSFRLTTSGYPRPTVTHTTLPRGLKWKVEGGTPTISGSLTAGQLGPHQVTVSATNIYGTTTQVLVIQAT
jgi:hypothetical protein